MKKYLTYETIMNKYEHIEKIWQNMNNYEKLKHEKSEKYENISIFIGPRRAKMHPRHAKTLPRRNLRRTAK